MKHAGKRALAFILCLILCAGMLQFGALAAEPLSVTGIKANKTTASTGESITWTATATGGTGTLRYCFYVFKDGAIAERGAYGTSRTYTYTPAAAGAYTVRVYVKDAAGTAIFTTSAATVVS
jgi:hypothetical protein